jgi:hypothetical protein
MFGGLLSRSPSTLRRRPLSQEGERPAPPSPSPLSASARHAEFADNFGSSRANSIDSGDSQGSGNLSAFLVELSDDEINQRFEGLLVSGFIVSGFAGGVNGSIQTTEG